jgi:HAE1 family hydrophobic/amphiphilic exporter-1
MKLAAICVRHPVFATMLTGCLLVLGSISFGEIGVDLYPKVDFPTVSITTMLAGAGPEEIETTVTKPIEEAVNTVNGIDELTSTTIEGISRVRVMFALERDPEVAAQDVRDRVSAIIGQLPPEIEPPIIEKMDPDAAPIMSVTVSSPSRDLREITEIADKQIKQRLETVNGIGQVLIVGGRRREIHVEMDGEKLDSYGITIDQVRQALMRENVETPGGKVEQGKSEMSLRVMGRVDVPREFGQIIVLRRGDALVRISDLGRVEDGYEQPVASLSRLDNRDAVTLLIRKQSGTNTLKIIELCKAHVERIKPLLPPDLQLQVIRDQSIFINASVHAIEEHLILGSILASLVVLLFMRNLRTTLIAAVAVPTSLVSTFFLMRVMDFTINSYTMLALMLAVGIVIDDAIVVLENIFRYIEEKDYAPAEAAIAATKEIAMAVMATTLSLVVIFVPIAFLSGISGKFLHSFGITMSFAIMVSMFVSFTLTPMMCSVFIKPMAKRVAAQDLAAHQARLAGGHRISKHTGFYAFIDRHYTRMLEWSMAHRAALVCIAGLIFISMFPVYQKIGKEYIPRDDQDEFSIGVKTPEGTSIEGTNAVLKSIEARVWKLRGVKHVLGSINSSRRASVTDADIYVRLVPLSERTFNWLNPVHLYRYLTAEHPEQRFYTQFEVMADARRMLRAFPGIRTGVATISGLGTGGRGGGEIEFNIRGPDLAQLSVISNQIMAEMKKAPGLTDVDSTINLGYPELRVRVDRDKAADLGVRVGDVASALRTMISGEERLTRFKDLDDQYEVRLRVHASNRRNADSIAQLMIPSSRLGQVHLENVATLYRDLGPAEINRYNRARQISVSCNLETWKPMGEAVADVKNVIESVGLPAGYDYRVAGRARRLEETMRDFAKAFLLSLVFMYMILASQFDSFIHPITIMSAIPMSIPFALLSLMATGRTLNMRSALGILLLFGIVKKNGILQVDFTNVLRRKGMPRYQAIIEANRTRLRPILMTTISIIAGLIPAALSKGPGSAQNTAIAISVIGGQTFCLLLTLLLTPVLYSLFDDVAQLFRRSPEKAPAAAPGD